MIGTLNLTGYDPVETYQNLVTTNGTDLANGSGSILTSINITASNAISASFEVLYETSSSYAETSSWALQSVSASYAKTSSIISPSAGVVSDMANATGSSAGAAGFTSVAELGSFILAVSSSFVTLNDLIVKLKAKGIIS